jgi:hypothetical protein
MIDRWVSCHDADLHESGELDPELKKGSSCWQQVPVGKEWQQRLRNCRPCQPTYMFASHELYLRLPRAASPSQRWSAVIYPTM